MPLSHYPIPGTRPGLITHHQRHKSSNERGEAGFQRSFILCRNIDKERHVEQKRRQEKTCKGTKRCSGRSERNLTVDTVVNRAIDKGYLLPTRWRHGSINCYNRIVAL